MTTVEKINASTASVAVNKTQSAEKTNSDPIIKGSENNKTGDSLELSGKKLTFDEMLEQGVITPEKKSFLFFKINTGNYIYTADGEKTYGEIKEELQLEDGALRSSNYELFENIDGNADSKKPAEGTALKIHESDFPGTPVNFKNKDGEELSGFYKTPGGKLYYEVQSGDTQESIYEMLSDKAFKDYKTADAMHGYPQETLSVGAKVELPEKSWFGKLFS